MQKQHGTGINRSQDALGCVSRLAEFFPAAVPVRIPVQVSKINIAKIDGAKPDTAKPNDAKNDSAAVSAAEQTIIEFGTPGEVIFASGLPLDFEDTVRMKNFDGSFDVSAEIIAMQLDRGETAVAARFLEDVTNWIIK